MKLKKEIKKLNKYLVSFDYLDKIFITLSASFITLSFIRNSIRFTSWYCGSSLTLVFTIRTGINKSLLRVNKKEKRNTIK